MGPRGWLPACRCPLIRNRPVKARDRVASRWQGVGEKAEEGARWGMTGEVRLSAARGVGRCRALGRLLGGASAGPRWRLGHFGEPRARSGQSDAGPRASWAADWAASRAWARSRFSNPSLAQVLFPKSNSLSIYALIPYLCIQAAP